MYNSGAHGVLCDPRFDNISASVCKGQLPPTLQLLGPICEFQEIQGPIQSSTLFQTHHCCSQRQAGAIAPPPSQSFSQVSIQHQPVQKTAIWGDIKLNDNQSLRRYRPTTQKTETEVEW